MNSKRHSYLSGNFNDFRRSARNWGQRPDIFFIMCMYSVVSDSVTLWTVACQAALSMGLSRQEYWSRLPFPTPGDLPDPGIEPTSLVSSALAGGFFYHCATWEAFYYITVLFPFFIAMGKRMSSRTRLRGSKPSVATN